MPENTGGDPYRAVTWGAHNYRYVASTLPTTTISPMSELKNVEVIGAQHAQAGTVIGTHEGGFIRVDNGHLRIVSDDGADIAVYAPGWWSSAAKK